ncbi:MAG TPA: hypothetical protein VLH16_00850, partial [Bacteroidales bacterium]|nr:hypothetical protein [Bacteroidales bacterium]
TNHLDMVSKDLLKNALIQFSGTLIIVSHDRDFLQGLTNKVFEFKNKSIKEYIGDVYDFLQSRKLTTLKTLEAQKRAGTNASERVQTSDSKLQWEERKNREKALRRLRSEVEKCENIILISEQEIARLDQILANPDRYREVLNDPEVYGRYNELKYNLEKEMQRWEELHKKLENAAKE